MNDDLPLLPCPFCGHVGLDFNEGSTFRWLAYSCGKCGMGSETRMQTLGEGTKEEWLAKAERIAIEEWNTRASSAAPQALTLTDEQIDAVTREQWGYSVQHPSDFAAHRAFARAVLAAAQKPTV